MTLGSKRFHAGDRELTPFRSFLCDGTTMWIKDKAGHYVTYDPATDARAKGEPAWFADYRRPGWEVTAILLPAPTGLSSSPLGLANGTVGLRWRHTSEWEDRMDWEYERIDGVRATLTREVFALINYPGDATPRAIDTERADGPRFLGGDGCGIELLSASSDRMCVVNEDAWAARGWGDVLVPPASFWDFLTPRDPAGSAALRAITDDQARELLTAARREIEAGQSAPRSLPETEAAVRRVMPDITDPKLVAGIAGIAERAAELAKQVAEIAEARSAEHADPSGQGLLGEAAQLRKLAKALAAGKERTIEDCEVDPREWLVDVRARVALSLSPIVEDAQRRKARDMLQALSGTIFADDLSRMRILDLEEPADWDNDIEWGTVQIQKHEGSVYAIDANSDWAIELSTDGTFRVPPVAGTPYMWNIDKATPLTRGVGTTWADRFLELPDEPLPWDPAIGLRLAEAAGLGVPEAVLLWINVRGMSTWSRDFLGKAKRELLGGLKVNEVDAAKTTFAELDGDAMLALFSAAVPDDPALLRTPLAPGGLVERLGAAWKAKYGKRAKIPQDLIAGAKKDLELGSSLGKLLPAFAGAADDAWFLKPDLRPLHELGGWRDQDGLTNDAAGELVALVSWLFHARPVGCPIRAGIAEVVDRLSAVIDDPRLVWPFDHLYIDHEQPKEVARAQQILDAIGGEPVAMPDDGTEKATGGRDDGICVVAAYPTSVYGGFRPARLDAKTRSRIDQLAKLLNDPELDNTDGFEAVRHAECLRSSGFRAFAARVRETPVASGRYECHPLDSTPKLVMRVASDEHLSEAAASLFLQTLALAEPTQARVCAWNGWKPKQYKDAAAELVKKKLVIEGKRERAGRTVFLKGGYSKGRGKNLPMEEWKQPFYQTIDRHLPAEPCHLLFARAYQRFAGGDRPK